MRVLTAKSPFLRENRTRRTRALARAAPEFPDFLDWAERRFGSLMLAASHIVARVRLAIGQRGSTS